MSVPALKTRLGGAQRHRPSIQKLHFLRNTAMGPEEIHLWVLRELAGIAAKPLVTVFEKLWQSGKVHDG